MDFIDRISSATTPQAVIDTLASAAERHEAPHVSYRLFTAQGDHLGLSTMPQDWLSHYADQGYVALDPGARAIREAKGPHAQSFVEGHPSFTFEERVRAMFLDMHQLEVRGSYFVPLKYGTGGIYASVNFLSNEGTRLFDAWAGSNRARFDLMAAVVHQRMMELGCFEQVTELSGPGTTGAPLHVDRSGQRLSPREREALEWLARGLRQDRIGERMGLSARTVEFHLGNARKKLGAVTREQALARALLEGDIHVRPEREADDLRDRHRSEQ